MFNHEVKQILLKTINVMRKDRALKLDEALWDYRTTYKTLIGTSFYKVVYKKSFHLHVELEHQMYWAIRKLNLDLELASCKLLEQLEELDEFRFQAYENAKLYK